MVLSTIVLVVGVSATIYVSNSWIPHDEHTITVIENLNIVLSAVTDQGIVQNSVNRLIQRTFNYLLQFLMTLDDAGILQFDCLALGSHLTSLCIDESGQTENFACNLFIVQHENLFEALEEVYRPLDGETRLAQELAFGPIFNTTSLRKPFVNYVSEAVSDNVVKQANKLYPQVKYMVTIPTVIAAIVAFAVSMSLSCVVLPSLVSTTLKLRSGFIPTFRNKDFSKYHYEVNNVTKLTGGMFWSNAMASLVIGSTIGFLVFLTLWQVSIHLVQKLFASLIGVYIIVTARWVLYRWFRKSYNRGFYCIAPSSANVFSLANECLDMGVTITMTLIRVISLFLLSEFYVGRLDTPFVANGVGNLDFIDLSLITNGFSRQY
jgi:hypothetical protein